MDIMEEHFAVETLFSKSAGGRKTLNAIKNSRILLGVYLLVFGIIASSSREGNSMMPFLTLGLNGYILYLLINKGKGKATVSAIPIFETHLKMLCQKMNINYYSTGLGSAEFSSSTWVGWGGWGAVAAGAFLTAASALGKAQKKANYKKASLAVSYNQIADYFNRTYFPEEYEAYCDTLPKDI